MAEESTVPPVSPPALNELARSIMAEILTPQNLQKLAKNQQNVALEGAKDAIELGWKVGAWAPILIAKAILGIMHGGEAEFDELSKVAVDGLFGGEGIRHGRSKEYTATVSAKILDALTNGGTSIEPNEDAARHFLDVATHLEIEGWMLSWISELATDAFGLVGVQHLEKFGDLKDGIAHAMGLSRLSRRVFGPYVDTFITTPTKQSLNKKFQPHGMSPSQAAKHYFRGFIDFSDFYEVCVRDGLNERAIEALQYDTRKYLSPADVALLVESTRWTRAQGVEHLRESGLEADQAEVELQLQDVKALRAFQEKSIGVAVDAYVAGDLDQAGLDRELAGGVVDPVARDRHRFLALKRRELRRKDITHLQAESAVELEVWGITDYRAWLDRQGYSHDDALTLELLLLAKLKKLDSAQKARAQAAAARAETKAAHLQALQAKRDALALEHQDFSGTIAQAERLAVRGVIEPGRYRRVLIDNGYTSEDASALMTLVQSEATAYAATVERRRQAIAKANQQELAIATLERAVRAGQLPIEDFRAELLARHFTVDQAQLLVGVLAADLARQTAAEELHARAAARLEASHLSLAQEETAVKDGVKTLADYAAFLASHDFTADDVQTLTTLLTLKLGL